MNHKSSPGLEKDFLPYYFNSETRDLISKAIFLGRCGAIRRGTEVFERLESSKDRQYKLTEDVQRFLPLIWLYVKVVQYFEKSSSCSRQTRSWTYRRKLASLLHNFLTRQEGRSVDLSLDEAYILAQAATTAKNWATASLVIKKGLEYSKKSPGHHVRGRLSALAIMNPKIRPMYKLDCPEYDLKQFFGSYDLKTKVLIYQAYADALKKRFPIKAAALAYVASKLANDTEKNSPIDYEINFNFYRVLHENLGRGRTPEGFDLFNCWLDRFNTTGQTTPYPTG